MRLKVRQKREQQNDRVDTNENTKIKKPRKTRMMRRETKLRAMSNLKIENKVFDKENRNGIVAGLESKRGKKNIKQTVQMLIKSSIYPSNEFKFTKEMVLCVSKTMPEKKYAQRFEKVKLHHLGSTDTNQMIVKNSKICFKMIENVKKKLKTKMKRKADYEEYIKYKDHMHRQYYVPTYEEDVSDDDLCEEELDEFYKDGEEYTNENKMEDDAEESLYEIYKKNQHDTLSLAYMDAHHDMFECTKGCNYWERKKNRRIYLKAKNCKPQYVDVILKMIIPKSFEKANIHISELTEALSGKKKSAVELKELQKTNERAYKLYNNSYMKRVKGIKSLKKLLKYYFMVGKREKLCILSCCNYILLKAGGFALIKQEYGFAYLVFEIAKDLGSVEAFYQLGILNMSERIDRSQHENVPFSFSQAFANFSTAASYGHSGAITNIGTLFYENTQYDRAVSFYICGAVMGCDYAFKNLGKLFERGHGVEQCHFKALEYYSLSPDPLYINRTVNNIEAMSSLDKC